MTSPPIRKDADTFGHSAKLRTGEPSRLERLSLQDVNEIRLLLRGESVVDWHRLDFQEPEQALRLLSLNGISLDDPDDQRQVAQLRRDAGRYIQETLRLRVDDSLVSDVPFVDVLMIASGRGRLQRDACLLLKVMHILYHLDARELRTRLAISDNDLFSEVEEAVVSMFDELRHAGVPVVEFSWSRKTRSSLLTKMLVKQETSAARVFDRLRFRLIVERADDLPAALHVMLHRCIPFNYVVPGQTVNTLLDPQALDGHAERLGSLPNGGVGFDRTVTQNEFSAKEFKMLNFIADLPVPIDKLVWGNEDLAMDAGRVVFVLAEFQVMDDETARANESGPSSHADYKARQHVRVKERLLHRPHADED